MVISFKVQHMEREEILLYSYFYGPLYNSRLTTDEYI
jgi:hypothetical protein